MRGNFEFRIAETGNRKPEREIDGPRFFCRDTAFFLSAIRNPVSEINNPALLDLRNFA